MLPSLVKFSLCALLLSVIAWRGDCFKPVRIGDLRVRNPTSNAGQVEGLVFFLNHNTLYIRNFKFEVLGAEAYFCAKLADASGYTVLDQSNSFQTGTSMSDLEVTIDSSLSVTVANIAFVGVCGATDGSMVYASIIVIPATVANVPCSTTFLGNFPSGNNGIKGRVYLLDRKTFAIVGFSFDGTSSNVFFWTGSGDPSASGIQALYGSNLFSGLEAIEDQDVLVKLNEAALGSETSYLALWSRTDSTNLGHVSFDAAIIPTVAPPVTLDSPVLIGSFRTLQHRVQGDVYALDQRTFMIKNFVYDGNAPRGVFYAVEGPSVRARVRSWILPDDDAGALREYNNENVIVSIRPDAGYTIHDLDFLSVWCVPFRANFGDVQITAEVKSMISQGEVIIPTLPPITPCPVLQSTVAVNCKQLSRGNDGPGITVSWLLDREFDEIVISLCGCVQPDNYIAFGLSGLNDSISMVGGDVVWTWLDNEGIHAGDLYLSAYEQCVFEDGTVRGACPDQDSNDVYSVSGFRDECTTCITYYRPLTGSSPEDRPITPGVEQLIIWSSGPVGSVNTETGERVLVPFRHFTRASPSDIENLKLDFGREPIDECTLECGSDCDEKVDPWERPVLEHTTTITAQIGQSGNARGYQGITGVPGWGISWYLNGLLIPEVRFRRGVTYVFKTEGGEDPAVGSRYHPFYITDSMQGGYLIKSPEDRADEVIYAGFDGETPLGVGRYCEYANKDGDRSLEFDTFEKFRDESLDLVCDEGTAGSFTWTPDEDTPDTVYYQCATHQFLGFTAIVEGSGSIPVISHILLCMTALLSVLMAAFK